MLENIKNNIKESKEFLILKQKEKEKLHKQYTMLIERLEKLEQDTKNRNNLWIMQSLSTYVPS